MHKVHPKPFGSQVSVTGRDTEPSMLEVLHGLPQLAQTLLAVHSERLLGMNWLLHVHRSLAHCAANLAAGGLLTALGPVLRNRVAHLPWHLQVDKLGQHYCQRDG